MAKGRWWVVAAALAGCGKSETKFVLEYTDAYCAYYLKCADSALQVFDGLDTKEECEAAYGPAVADHGSACKLVNSAAKACLDGMAALPCPAADAALEDALPPACAAVWDKCDAGNGGGGDAG